MAGFLVKKFDCKLGRNSYYVSSNKMATLLGGIVINGVELLRKEIASLEEMLHTKTQRLHEMESFLVRLQGRPSSVSYEAEVLETSMVTIATVDASAPTGDPLLSKLKHKEVLKIFYKNKVIGTGVLHYDANEKKGYSIIDKEDKKKYNTFSKWSFAKKKELNPSLNASADDGKRAVNCFRDGQWIKLADLS
jgi:hypothetical protein